MLTLRVGDPVCVVIVRLFVRWYEPGIVKKVSASKRFTVEMPLTQELAPYVFNPDGSCRGNPNRCLVPMTHENRDEMDQQNLQKYVQAVTGLTKCVKLTDATVDAIRSIVENDANVLEMKKAKEANGQERTGDTAGPQPEDGGGP